MSPDPSPAPRPSIDQEIAALRGLTVPELAVRYEELWGKPPRSRHREHMWKRAAWKLQERRSGGLSEVAKARLEELIAEIELPPAEQTRTVSGALRRKPVTIPPRGPAPGTVFERE